MADGVLFILLNDSLPVVWLIFRCCINNEFYLVLNLYEQIVPVWFPFDKFYGMAHQFHQAVIVRELALTVCYAPGKRGVLLDVPCDINGSLDISVIVSVPYIPLEQTFSHCCFEIIREQEQQEVKEPVILIGIGFHVHDVRKIKNAIKEILKEEILILSAKA